ncbi:hypothetical protein AB0J21_27570 [Streptomyces sp. NPDC049954]|uniref:hypothetical protein n=1 Tax=Streptomyces sp. NPDC049954 TaxID=3155779 RepID=UPI0034472617
MTKKMRVRVARIAAGAVIAAGASLTAAGAAQALEFSSPTPSVAVDEPTDEPTEPPTDEPTEPPTDEPTEPPTDEPTEPPTDEPTEPTEEPTQPTEEPTQPTEEPTQPTEEPTQPTEEPSAPGGGSTEAPSANPSLPAQGGSGSTPGAGQDDISGPGPDNAGSQPVEQGEVKDELAETGSGDTTFLILGAATMIAGGIGFRFLPRLANNRTAA